MTETNLVRPSRDGDQFHYFWASRRCLLLLNEKSNLAAVTIEGPSNNELAAAKIIEEGVEVIDVGEYYGDENIEKANRIVYSQLKHSTLHATNHWTPSGLANTLIGFSIRYKKLKEQIGDGATNAKVRFAFVTNRPISAPLRETIDDLASENNPRHREAATSIETYTGLNGTELAAFCRLLSLKGEEPGLLLQRHELTLEVRYYLPGDDVSAPLELKELVTRKALSEEEHNPSVIKADVLRVLGTTEESLFPAKSKIDPSPKSIPRKQEADISKQISEAVTSVVITAAGGVGKTVLTQRLANHLPQGSVAIVYDCFGNGEYRRAASPRHRHKDAMVQIVNELSAMGLCDPIIPSPHADASDYVKAFAHRLGQCSLNIKAQSDTALVCIAIDAADNAEMAAVEFGDSRSFVRDILRIEQIENVKIVAFCRPERLNLLDPPANSIVLELESFSLAESTALLMAAYPNATEGDSEEFHRLTSANPRLQATALSQGAALSDVLRSLAPGYASVDDAIGGQLQNIVNEIAEKSGAAEYKSLETLCVALATLRPLVPISVLSAASSLSPKAVESFALDFGRPLLISDGSIQFRDEPVESWFRKTYRPSPNQLKTFIDSLLPLAAKEPYVAATLPQMLLEAGEVTKLVQLAMSGEALPEGNPVQRREIENNRSQFALKACLRNKDYVSAAKLAMRAAAEAAGDTRQQHVIQENTDIAARLLDQNTINEIVSRHTFGGGWIGAHNVYEAGLLSNIDGLRGEARSRIRLANEWLLSWSRLPPDEREKEKVHEADIAELCLAYLNVEGPEACVQQIERWKPKTVAYKCGRIISARLIDQGRIAELTALANAANNNIRLVAAFAEELRQICQHLPQEIVISTIQRLSKIDPAQAKLKQKSASELLEWLVPLSESALHYGIQSAQQLGHLINEIIPTFPSYRYTGRHGSERLELLRAYSVAAELIGTSATYPNLKESVLPKDSTSKQQNYISDTEREFRDTVGAVLPWQKRRTSALVNRCLLGSVEEELGAIQKEKATAGVPSHMDDDHILEEIAITWLEILIYSNAVNRDNITALETWIGNQRRSLYTPTLVKIARMLAHSLGGLEFAYGFATRAYKITADSRDDAVSVADMHINIARAIMPADKLEAAEYFNHAITAVSKYGDEVLERWQSIIAMADRSASNSKPKPRLAYELSRCAEFIYSYVDRDKHYDWGGTLKAISDLCPASSFAIISRWRDRTFGWYKRILAVTATHLLSQGKLGCRLAFSLVGFDAHWDYAKLLTSFFEVESDPGCRQLIFDRLMHFAPLRQQGENNWEEVKRIAGTYQVESSAAEALERERELRESRQRQNKAQGYDLPENKERTASDWDQIFLNLPLHTAIGISQAYGNFRNSEPPLYASHFARELFRRIKADKAIDCINALANVPEIKLFDFADILQEIPPDWKPRLAVQKALLELSDWLARRYCLEISKGRFYQPFPLDKVERLTGQSEWRFVEKVIEALSNKSDNFSASRLFTLVELISNQLTADQAETTLEFGLSLISESFSPEEGDGPWKLELAGPNSLREGYCGYIWSSLASHSPEVRWEAAHSIRWLAALGCKAEIDQIIDFAASGSAGPYVDASFDFYRLHAVQWLMIAISRIAGEYPEIIVSQRAFLMNWATKNEPHILIRRFAAEALHQLNRSGHLLLTDDEINALNKVGKSPFPLKQSEKYSERMKEIGERSGATKGATKFIFDHELVRNEFGSLGMCFARSENDVETAAEKVIRERWKFPGTGRWDSDPRANKGVYSRGGSRLLHGTYPGADTLSYYLTYHSMLVVAGDWLSTLSLYQDPEGESEFEAWFDALGLSRLDGLWLSDVRRPAPCLGPSYNEDEMNENWQWSVSKPYFENAIGLNTNALTVHGDWVSISSWPNEEAVHVASAFVSRAQSIDLLAALQSASDRMSYCMPMADGHLEIDFNGYQLKGWILRSEGRDGLDRQDGWAGDIRYNPIRPSSEVCQALDLIPSKGDLIWMSRDEQVDGRVEIQNWGERAKENSSGQVEHGERLSITPSLLKEMLTRMQIDLIVEVTIERKNANTRYGIERDDGLRYVPGYTRLFLFGADGTIKSV